MTSTIPVAQAMVISAGLHQMKRPLMPEAIAQGAEIKAINANKVPPLFDKIARSTRPRTKYAQLVVMPQDGHRIPVAEVNVHGGKPICS